ncbi:MAG: tetratricopeptide repeat protein [Candidatus Omnitrophota bacterium]|nr:tetratricopeptide repeat protein [Candidatus Omnitrophota bacterium]
MNKLKLKTIVAGGLILIAGIGLMFFANKSKNLSRKLQDLSGRLEEISPGYQKLSQEESALKDKNAQLFKENEAIKIDRENLMVQIKTLLQERSRANELAVSLEKANNDLAALAKEKSQLQDSNLNQKDEISRLLAAQKKLIAKWDTLKAACEKAETTVRIKELNRNIGDLQKEKAAIQNSAKRKEDEFDQLRQQKSKLDSENISLKLQLKDCQQGLAEAMKKNKRMWEEMQNTPKKFTELARQNKLLIAETAQMHYNLGIFYTKNKQYDRAAVEFEKVIEIDPNNAYAQFNLGYIYAEYLVNRQKAAKHFRYYLGLAKGDDKDMDWVKKYLLTWEAYDGKGRVQ